MALVKPILSYFKVSGKYVVFIVVGVLVFIWSTVTPAGILGKADAVGYAVCHRIDLRSFHIGIRQLPFCARCTGQYVGAMLGLVFQSIYAQRRSGFPPKRVVIVLAILSMAYFMDGLNSYLYLPPLLKVFPGMPHLYEPSNALRLFTGTGMGLVIALIMYPAFIGSIYTQPYMRPSMGGLVSTFSLIGLSVVIDLLILKGSSYILYPAALVSASGVIVLLTMVYSTVLLWVFGKVNKYTSLSQVSLLIISGFLVTMSQIAVFDLIRFIITRTWSGLVFG